MSGQPHGGADLGQEEQVGEGHEHGPHRKEEPKVSVEHRKVRILGAIALDGEVGDQVAAARAVRVVGVVRDALPRLEDEARGARQQNVRYEDGGVERALQEYAGGRLFLRDCS